MKTKTFADFEICISVPLTNEKLRTYNAYRKNIDNSQLRKNLSSFQQRLRV